MIQHLSTTTYKTTIQGLEFNTIIDDGEELKADQVRFTVLKLSHGARSLFRQKASVYFAQIREITEVIEDVIDEYNLNQEDNELDTSLQLVIPLDENQKDTKPKGAKFNKQQLRAIERISDENRKIQIINNLNVDPLYLDIAFKSIEGLLIDGLVPTAKLIYEKGPEGLCEEIIRWIKINAGIATVEVKENLELPITSGAVVDGQAIPTIAQTVNEKDTGKAEIAPDSSLST